MTFAGAVLITVLIGGLLWRTGHKIRASWFLVRLWRWLSGEAHHGEPLTDAGWLRPGRRALTRTGYAGRWWHLPRWKRAAWRSGGTFTFTAIVWGLITATLLTLALLALTLAAGLVFAGWRLWLRIVRRRHERTWLHPLHLAAHELAGHARAVRAASWITAELDEGGAVREVRLALPQGWQADPKDEQKLVSIAAAKTGIEAPEASWRRAGPAPGLILTHGEPPPPFVEYGKDDLGVMLADAVARASSNEIVVGLGKPEKGSGRPKVVKASLSLDSPHFAINMGSGAGKSNLAAFWVMQELRRGAIVMVLDSKQFSHPWLFKDENGDYAQLPNVSYLWTPPQIHAGMMWLGAELDRRNKVARRAVDATGRLRGDVGPRLIILAEELNFATPQLKEYWAEIRERDDPKKSPALTSFGAVSFAGRAVKMHLFLIGQMLTAAVTGSQDSSVKENVGVTAMARYGAPGWATAVGKNVPMPPCPDVMGRVQLVTAGSAREVQTPLGDLLLYRELATSGTLTPCPAGMPGIAVPDARQLPASPSDLPVVPETGPYLGLPPVTLSEAVGQGIVRRSLAALRKASQRDGFPERVGMSGLAAQYDPVKLAEWDAGRRLWAR